MLRSQACAIQEFTQNSTIWPTSLALVIILWLIRLWCVCIQNYKACVICVCEHLLLTLWRDPLQGRSLSTYFLKVSSYRCTSKLSYVNSLKLEFFLENILKIISRISTWLLDNCNFNTDVWHEVLQICKYNILLRQSFKKETLMRHKNEHSASTEQRGFAALLSYNPPEYLWSDGLLHIIRKIICSRIVLTVPKFGYLVLKMQLAWTKKGCIWKIYNRN